MAKTEETKREDARRARTLQAVRQRPATRLGGMEPGAEQEQMLLEQETGGGPDLAFGQLPRSRRGLAAPVAGAFADVRAGQNYIRSLQPSDVQLPEGPRLVGIQPGDPQDLVPRGLAPAGGPPSAVTDGQGGTLGFRYDPTEAERGEFGNAIYSGTSAGARPGAFGSLGPRTTQTPEAVQAAAGRVAERSLSPAGMVVAQQGGGAGGLPPVAQQIQRLLGGQGAPNLDRVTLSPFERRLKQREQRMALGNIADDLKRGRINAKEAAVLSEGVRATKAQELGLAPPEYIGAQLGVRGQQTDLARELVRGQAVQGARGTPRTLAPFRAITGTEYGEYGNPLRTGVVGVLNQQTGDFRGAGLAPRGGGSTAVPGSNDVLTMTEEEAMEYVKDHPKAMQYFLDTYRR